MSADIKIPLQFDDLREDNGSGFFVSEILDEELATAEELTPLIEDFITMVESEVDIEQRHIDAMFNVVSALATVNDEDKASFVESLCNFIIYKLENISEQSSTKDRNELKMAVYFLQQFAVKVEGVIAKSPSIAVGDDEAPAKPKGKGAKKASKATAVSDFAWSEWRHRVLDIFLRVLAIDTSALWFMGIPEEAFLAGLWKYALLLLEEKPAGVGGIGHAETKIRGMCQDVVFASAQQLGGSSASGDEMTTMVTAVVDSICRVEHMGLFISDLCKKENGRFAASVMSEIGAMNLIELGKSGSGVKNVGSFLVALSESAPKLMAVYLPTFIHLLDSEVYQIRSCIIQVMGNVINYTHSVCTASPASEEKAEKDSEEDGDSRHGEQFKRVRDSMMDMLVERTYDVSSFTRAVVLKTWSFLAESGSIPLARVESVAEVAVDRLKDKTAAVRKAAIGLLTSLIINNPFGGVLDSDKFKARRTEIEALLKARKETLTIEIGRQIMQNAGANTDAIEKDVLKASPKIASIKEEDEVEDKDDDNKMDTDEKTHSVSTKNHPLSAASEQQQVEEDEEEEPVEIAEDPDVIAHRNGIKFCNSAIKFVEVIVSCMPFMELLLASKTVSDVTEVLRFLARAVKFSVPKTAECLQKSLSLIWHGDETIRIECRSAFLNVHLTDGAIDAEASLLPPQLIAKNLVSACSKCTVSELTSMEKIIGELFSENFLKSDVFDALWAMGTQLSRCVLYECEEEASADFKAKSLELASALRVIAMVAKFNQSVMSPARVNGVLQILLSNEIRSKKLFSVMRSCAICLQMLPNLSTMGTLTAPKDTDGSVSAMNALIYDATEGIQHILLGDFVMDDGSLTREWFIVAEELLHATFHVHPAPDTLLSSLIPVMFDRIYCTENKSQFACSPARLSRLLFILGQGAICSLVYAEKAASAAKKERERRAALDADAKRYNDSDKTASSSDAQEGEGGNGADSMEAEMGMAAAVDAEHEQIFTRLVEFDLVANPENILGKFHQMIAFIVANERGNFNDPMLRETALLSLCRYMASSSIICEKYLPLLFTVLEREEREANRTTLMIAIGDLAFRFPNSLEPWIAHMYARLTDSSLLVRYNTLMVLTHLILNDMIKVKGQVSQVVMCLNDSSEKVRDLACMFFTELSKRSNNPVYNLLGDIISILSKSNSDLATSTIPGAPKMSRSLTQAEFQSTMTFLLSFVKKDKQADSLLERLVVRMGVTPGLQQRRSLAFCVSLLPITEKGVKKMTELIKHIKDSLTDDNICECFKTCLSRVKKSFQKGVASEVNAVLDEFEAAVAQIRGEKQLEEGDSNKEEGCVNSTENESVDELTRDLAESLNVASDVNSKKKAPAATTKKAVKKGATGKAAKKTTKKRNAWSDDESGAESEVGDENEAEADFDAEEVKPKSRRAVAPQDAVPAKGAASASSSRKPLKEVGNTRVKA